MLDPILTELRQIRDAYSDKYHGDVTAMLAALRASGEASGRKTVTLTPRQYSPPQARSQGGEIAGAEGFYRRLGICDTTSDEVL